MDVYTPGLHLIGELNSEKYQILQDSEGCRFVINELIAQQDLSKIGEVYHSFDSAGFTATICLTESHIAIHTWPEYGKVTFDVFLSNFRKNNDEKCEAIFDALSKYFGATSVNKNSIRR
jgi:S-adenosylmethionine decarboxylase